MGSEVRMKNVQTTTMIHEPVRGMDFVEGVSPSMRSVEAVMREVAQSEVPVLLLAERGAGKKATARRVHELSRHAKQTFRLVSCGTLESGKWADSDGQAGSVRRRHGFSGGGGGIERRGSGMVASGFDPGRCERRPFARHRPADLRKRPRPGSGSKGGESPRGSLLPDQRSVFAASSAAPASGRYSGADGAFSAEIRAGFSARGSSVECGDAAVVSGIFLAGERARAGERGQGDHGAGG